MTPKLHKSFKKGLYIVSLVHQKGKVLVTGEDVLPTIEIQCEQTPSSVALKSDFYWLSKVICNWSNVKPLKNIFERPSTITDSLHFRSCLLQSVYQMQKIVGYEDLGNLHYQILNDPNSGSQIFLFIKNLPDDLRVTSSLKWGSVNKLIKKKMNSFEKSEEKAEQAQMDTNTMDYITANIPDLVSFNDSCVTRLPRGLYIGYVKLTSYIDQLRIIVPDNLSNVFPFVQVRNNAKVSSEEWDSLINLTATPTKLNKVDSTLQHNFINQLYESSLELMRDVGVPEEDFLEHRVYMNEVFEFSSEVSFILLMPNFKQVCSGLGEEEKTIPGHISLPLQQFEIYHMKTYHPDLTKRYALLSTLLEAEVGVTNHLIRQGVSSDDEMKLRNEIQILNQQQKKLDDAWKSMRWIAEVIGNARDSKSTSCLALENLRSRLNSPEDGSDASLTSTDTNLTFTFSTNLSEDVVILAAMLTTNQISEKMKN
ncbi:hypothetical protein HELRODRAFT_167861 [Helobdella robusta]|uniref:Uncharacterized protein n=1 Tax=Helobdella robusta TaxID=6412 RepID=T1EZW2_HELRO|nr:hypothetical protein HELRODRAFT_167861 [Helobdella robusta]ESO10024.1 hypothetical protein HELRODRAFT_167861 [Helobdella robusta]